MTEMSIVKRDDFKKIESEEEFVQLLKSRDLFREDDVTFDDLGADNMYLYTGDDFQIDADMLLDMQISALLVDGSVRAEFISVGDILPDFGVFCVTGDVRCKDFLYMTESTGMSVGGDLVIEHFFFSDCGNSVLQVNKSLRAKLFFNSQCSIDVRGEEDTQFDESATKQDLQSLGLDVSEEQRPAEAVRAYFDRYQQ
jgi:hypothetical protein